MIAVPFVYFSFFLYFLYKKNHRIDLAFYIISIYWISAFFSILTDLFGLRHQDAEYYKISFYATFVYCFLITFCTLPFIIFSSNSIKHIAKIPSSKPLKNLACFFMAWFVLFTILSTPTLIKILTGNIGQIRADHYIGEGISGYWFASLSTPVRLPISILNMVLGSTWILQFLGFYCIAIQKMPIKYGVMFITASLIGIVKGIMEAGRSDVIYWIIGIGANLVFFRPYLTKSVEQKIRKYWIFMLLIVASYFMMTTISRTVDNVGGEVGGAEGNIIRYTGETFINFCFYFDNYTCPSPTLEIIFPLTYKLLGIDIGGVVPIQQLLTQMTGYQYHTGVFYAFIGQILIATNIYIVYLYCFFYVLLSFSSCRKVKRLKYSIVNGYFYVLYASVLFLGLFSHYYGYAGKTSSLIVFSVIIAYINMKRRSLRKG